MLRYCQFLTIVFSLLLISLSALAQEKSASSVCVLHAPFPKHIFLPHGTTLRFEGGIPDPQLQVTFTIKVGGISRLQKSFYDKWSLDWDPTRLGPRMHLFLVAEGAGQQQILADMTVDILDGTPFTISQPLANSLLTTSAPIQVKSDGSLTADGYDVLLDNNPTGTQLDPSGKGALDISPLRPGTYSLIVAVHTGGGVLKTEPVSFTIPSKIRLKPVAPNNIVSLVPYLPDVPLSIESDPDLTPASVEYFIDDKPVGHSAAGPAFTFVFHPNSLGRGKHVLTATARDTTGKTFLSPALEFSVLRGARLEIGPWEEELLAQLDAVISGQLKVAEFSDRLYPRGEHVMEDALDVTQSFVITNGAVNKNILEIDYPPSLSKSDSDLLLKAVDYIKQGMQCESRAGDKMLAFYKDARAQGADSIGDTGPRKESFGACKDYYGSEVSDARKLFKLASSELKEVEDHLKVRRSPKHQWPFGTYNTPTSGGFGGGQR